MTAITRPTPDEYAPYYEAIIQSVPEGDIFDLLDQQIGLLRRDLARLSDEQANYRFGPDEWSIKEVVGHLNDVERIFSYRAMCFSRGDPAPLPGHDQDVFVRESNYGTRTLADLVQEFEWLRRANILAFRSLSAEAGQRRGTASDASVSVRALIYMLAGHVYHHIDSIRSDYLKSLPAH